MDGSRSLGRDAGELSPAASMAPAGSAAVSPSPILLPEGSLTASEGPGARGKCSSRQRLELSASASATLSSPSSSSPSSSSSSSHSSSSSSSSSTSPSLSSQSSPQSTLSSPTSWNAVFAPSLPSSASPDVAASLALGASPSAPDSGLPRTEPRSPSSSLSSAPGVHFPLLPSFAQAGSPAAPSAARAQMQRPSASSDPSTSPAGRMAGERLRGRPQVNDPMQRHAAAEGQQPLGSGAKRESDLCSRAGERSAPGTPGKIARKSIAESKKTPSEQTLAALEAVSAARASPHKTPPDASKHPSGTSPSAASPSGTADSGVDLTVASERLDGSRSRLCDTLATELAQQLEMIVEDTPGLLSTLNQDATDKSDALPIELEIEGRLGVLIDLDTGSRLRLPLSSLALLSSSFCSGGGGAPSGSSGLRFEAGVSQKQFTSIQEFIVDTVVGKAAPGQTGGAGAQTAGMPRAAGQSPGGQKRTRDQIASNARAYSSGVRSQAPEEEDYLSDWASLIDDDSSSEDDADGRASSRLRQRKRGKLRVRRERSPSRAVASAPPPEAAAWVQLPIQATEEEYHSLSCMPDTAIRVSYPHPRSLPGSLLPLGAIWKSNQMTWNLYAGQDSEQEWADDAARGGGPDEGCSAWGDDDSGRRRVDCRLAINIEHHPNLREVVRDLERRSKMGGRPLTGQGSQGPVMRRIRKRQSFVHPCGVRIDLTEVRMDMGGGGKGPGGKGRERLLFEVETELNSVLVLQAIQYKQMTGDSLPLLSLCVSFLTVLEDLSVHLNAVLVAASSGSGSFSQAAGLLTGPALSPAGEPRFADLSQCFPPSPSVALFKEYLSPCLPLIGDYAFRAVAKELAKKGEERLQDYLTKIDVDEKSLYTNDTVTIVGPWVPCLNEEGRLEFAVPVARPSQP
ncbi:mRNA capping enzyme, beta chain protein [Besnoitia besnoiti]|uniref:mRNA 5'-phosphatase n=1 Tax=Besnoitia besnoiti TaxID=94643 RepID=A0A2A9MIU9_BESBE|nr:mRNA capping enzyme, beta chain protein [Besnoitia besnoiti]PFH35312.1 mRNA capping enzyme, beta chain protein [Besnoitia besnoiti]